MRFPIYTHYKHLESYDVELWNDFNAELARKQLFKTFERSIAKNEKITLINLPSWIRTCMVKFMPWWSNENFDTLTWPDLPPIKQSPN
jgi:hypothetical protein